MEWLAGWGGGPGEVVWGGGPGRVAGRVWWRARGGGGGLVVRGGWIFGVKNVLE